MKLSIEILNILLLLLPGFVAGQIFYSIVSKEKEISTTKRLYDAVIFSFIISVVIALFHDWKPVAQVANIQGSLEYSFSDDFLLLGINLLLILTLPLIMGFILNNDYFHKLLRKMKITTKSSRPNTWLDVLLTENRHIVIHLKDERRIRGYPTKFSSDPEEGFIYLFNPAWIDEEKGGYIEANVHGFLINRTEIDIIEFTLNENETIKPNTRRQHG